LPRNFLNPLMYRVTSMRGDAQARPLLLFVRTNRTHHRFARPLAPPALFGTPPWNLPQLRTRACMAVCAPRHCCTSAVVWHLCNGPARLGRRAAAQSVRAPQHGGPRGRRRGQARGVPEDELIPPSGAREERGVRSHAHTSEDTPAARSCLPQPSSSHESPSRRSDPGPPARQRRTGALPLLAQQRPGAMPGRPRGTCAGPL